MEILKSTKLAKFCRVCWLYYYKTLAASMMIMMMIMKLAAVAAACTYYHRKRDTISMMKIRLRVATSSSGIFIATGSDFAQADAKSILSMMKLIVLESIPGIIQTPSSTVKAMNLARYNERRHRMSGDDVESSGPKM